MKSTTVSTFIGQALSGLKCRKRVLLSGTPMQNDLEEFYAMTDFTNPGVSERVRGGVVWTAWQRLREHM